MNYKLYWIWLTKIKGIGPIKVKKLLEEFATAQGIWEASREELNNVAGIGSALSSQLIKSKDHFSPSLEKNKLKKQGANLVTLQDKCYPKLLKEIYNPPPILYYQGSLDYLQAPCIAVVGTRNCSRYGEKIAHKLSERLAREGFTVISGLARGIDTKAHQGALRAGATYAVLGSGLDNIYPPENDKLATKIAQQGAVLTAYPLGQKPARKNFPARNRIISGLSLGTIVVEAPNKSGALITADFAVKQGREVFAIPGDVTKEQSVGPHKLIQTGAKLVQSLDDITAELLVEKTMSAPEKNEFKASNNKENDLEDQEKIVYQSLNIRAQQFEKILADVKIKADQLNSILLQLEIAGLIEQLPGNRFRKIN
ncbi:MAG: DNA-processing protein DprA [Bacillota bacterium]